MKVGKKLKKNNVSVDVVSFGASAEENKDKLEAFVAAVNKDANSHFVEVPTGSNLADFLLSSPVVSQASAGEAGGGAGGISIHIVSWKKQTCSCSANFAYACSMCSSCFFVIKINVSLHHASPRILQKR